MAYSRKVIFNCHKSISEAKKNKVLKVIKPEKYLFISIKTLNSQKQFFAKNVKARHS